MNKNIDVYANRGANGIDGIVSTALGMAVHRQITLLMGDLSFYHDMNGLIISRIKYSDEYCIIEQRWWRYFSVTTKKVWRLFWTVIWHTDRIGFQYTAETYQFDFKRLTVFWNLKMPHCYRLRRYIRLITNREDN